MYLRGMPLSLWPWRWHATLATTALLLVCVVGAWVVRAARLDLTNADAEVTKARADLAVAESGSAKDPASDALAKLPSHRLVDEVVGHISDRALANGVKVLSINLSKQAGTPEQVGVVTIQVQARGPYSQIRAWVGQSADRYPAAGVRSLLIRGGPDPSAQEVLLTLSLVTKD